MTSLAVRMADLDQAHALLVNDTSAILDTMRREFSGMIQDMETKQSDTARLCVHKEVLKFESEVKERMEGIKSLLLSFKAELEATKQELAILRQQRPSSDSSAVIVAEVSQLKERLREERMARARFEKFVNETLASIVQQIETSKKAREQRHAAEADLVQILETAYSKVQALREVDG